MGSWLLLLLQKREGRGLIHIAILAIFQIGEAGREGVQGGVRGNKKLGYRLIEARLQLEGGAKSRAEEVKLVRNAEQDSLIWPKIEIPL